MTPQDIFDKVATHLLTQGRPALMKDLTLDGATVCVYRDPKTNNRCAVGCLISDSVYQKGMENNSIHTLVSQFKMPKYFEDNIDLLSKLQMAHDFLDDLNKNGTFNKKSITLALADVAAEFSLDASVVTKFKGKK